MSKLRVEKVQEAIQHEISSMLLFDVKDARIHDVTITGVEVSPDLSCAKVYASLYGKEDTQEETWRALRHSMGFIRSEIAKRVQLRYTPELILQRDTTAAYSQRIEELLHKIKTDERKSQDLNE